jgi:hypothetical protein
MRTLILVAVLTSSISEQSGALSSLAAARELYASADYRGALDMLDELAAANPAAPDRQAIDLYRTFCLITLGRTREADETIAATLPAIVQGKYELAKGAFDRNDFKTALDGFTELLMVISDVEIAAQASRPPLSDLRVLAIGFKDLAARAIVPEPVPAPSPASARQTVLPAPGPPTPEVPKVVEPKTPRIYDSNDADVVAPVSVQQDMPQFHRPITKDRIGVLVVVIDEAGRVETATVTQSLDSYYDSMLLQSAKTWRYQPATRDGVAVKYRKLIQLTLPRQTK